MAQGLEVPIPRLVTPHDLHDGDKVRLGEPSLQTIAGGLADCDIVSVFDAEAGLYVVHYEGSVLAERDALVVVERQY